MASEPREQARLALQHNAEDLIEWTLTELYERFGEIYARFGDAGRRTCREDLRYHLAYVDGALVGGDATAFTDYVTWLAEVLRNRNVPVASLAESLRLMEIFVTNHLPPSLAYEINGILAAGETALAQPTNPATIYGRHLPTAMPEVEPLVPALIEGRHTECRRLYSLAAQGAQGHLSLLVRLLQPALYRVGELWQENRISVAQEHLASSIAQVLAAQSYESSYFEPPVGRRILCACVESNRHAIGLRMIADAFEAEGWEVQYLGADVPLRDLVAQARRWPPDMIALSVSTAAQLRTLQETIRSLRTQLGQHCPHVLTGGLALNQLPDAWRLLGADAWVPDALAAVEIARCNIQ